MVHSHSTGGQVDETCMEVDKVNPLPSIPFPNELSEPYTGKCYFTFLTKISEGDMITDQTKIFQQYVPQKSFATFAELERLLLDFQQV